MFGLNNAQIIGRLGADATVSHLTSGGRVANVSVATDESYMDRNSGDKVDRTEWHRIVTFQDGLVDMLEKHAKKGRLVYVSGKLQTRKWRKDGEDSDRYSTEILLVPGSRVQFLDKPNGNGAPGDERRRRCSRRQNRRANGRQRDSVLDDPSRRAFSLPPTQGRFPPPRRGTGSFLVPFVSSRASQVRSLTGGPASHERSPAVPVRRSSALRFRCVPAVCRRRSPSNRADGARHGEIRVLQEDRHARRRLVLAGNP